MKGIQFLTDYQGNKVAVLVDLKEHQAFWQDVIEETSNSKDFQFVINEEGKKIAVLLDLDKHEELWEDIYDSLITDLRENETTISWQEMKRQLSTKSELGV